MIEKPAGRQGIPESTWWIKIKLVSSLIGKAPGWRCEFESHWPIIIGNHVQGFLLW